MRKYGPDRQKTTDQNSLAVRTSLAQHRSEPPVVYLSPILSRPIPSFDIQELHIFDIFPAGDEPALSLVELLCCLDQTILLLDQISADSC